MYDIHVYGCNSEGTQQKVKPYALMLEYYVLFCKWNEQTLLIIFCSKKI